MRQRVSKRIKIFLASVLFVTGLGVQAVHAIIPASPQLAAEGYLLIDAATGTPLVEFNASQRLPPASLTKIMTSYVAAKEIERGIIALDDEVDVSIKAWRMEGSRMFIQEGTKVRLEDILRGIIVQSGNDASVALAEHVAGSEEGFADVMNQYAQQLGMTDTNFVNATGLPDENHYTTANDLARLTVALINQFPEHYKIYSEKYFTYSEIRQPNRNRLLMRDSSVDGVKTGHTDAAGYCLVASAVRGDMRLLSVVMGASSEEGRAAESQKLLTYGFRYFETAHLYRADESLRQVRVWGGKHQTVNLGLSADVVMTLPKGIRDELQAETQIQNEIHAPIEKGDELGSLTISVPDKEDISVPLTALNGVQQAGFFARIWDSILLFFVNISGGDPLEY
ncbi:MAG: D-alanyl-D-alanine carboxypeptidase [Gammaproteobacteria bacterium]|jgi:D-alanyl-D-alanine carboxypeptidase (penicillin-binding protein 5/6)|nr:D-alanyl-D-alanine carboxypeptidase [Gammaproteobacteria bacterium]